MGDTARPNLTATLAAALAGAIVAIICLSVALAREAHRPTLIVRQIQPADTPSTPTPGPTYVCPYIDPRLQQCVDRPPAPAIPAPAGESAVDA